MLASAGAGLADAQSSLSDEWLSVPAQSLAIVPGSALDFSNLLSPTPAGVAGAVTIVDGKLVFGSGTPAGRFNCGMISGGPNKTWNFPTHQEADALAAELRRHGINLVRFHLLEGRLVLRAKADFDYDVEDLDSFHYLLAALKREGIYWMIDVMSIANGALKDVFSRPRTPNDIKFRLNFDPQAREHWSRLMKDIYGSVNPYTGLTTLADPALAFVVGANENGLLFNAAFLRGESGRYADGLDLLFDKWLREQFAGEAELSAAVQDLTPDERAGRATISPPLPPDSGGGRSRLFLRFVSELEQATYRWMSEQLAENGYNGPLLQSAEWSPLLNNRTRGSQPIIDVHAYSGEVTSYDIGVTIGLPNSFSNGFRDWLTNLSARWLDRPIVASEYGVPFPNPTRYESGIVFPALASFQSFSTICRNAQIAVEPAILAPGPKAHGIFPYAVGLDPITRANDTLATLLFFRRDVADARGIVAAMFGEKEFERPGSGFIPINIRRAALLTGFGLVAPDKVGSLRAGSLVLALSKKPYTVPEKVVARLTDMITGSSDAQLARMVADMRTNGILAPDNITDTARGVFQSDTGEILFNQEREIFSVTTPRTEGLASVNALANLSLSTLSVSSLSSGALMAASSLDGKPLAESRRILFILAGDAHNSGLTLSGEGERKKVVDWGKLPILLQRVVARVTLKREVHGFKGRFSVLGLDGRIVESRPVQAAADDHVEISLDIGAVAGQPTTYFLLEEDASEVLPQQ